jgi:hypothetical protein
MAFNHEGFEVNEGDEIVTAPNSDTVIGKIIGFISYGSRVNAVVRYVDDVAFSPMDNCVLRSMGELHLTSEVHHDGKIWRRWFVA